MQRAIMGLCVAWKPLTAPHAMVMKSIGKMGSEWLGWWFVKASVISGIHPVCVNMPTRTPTAMMSSATPKTGYMRPMRASMGSSVARM